MTVLGIYRCSECNRSWASAYASDKSGQLCRECRKFTRPHRLITRKAPQQPRRRRRQSHRSDLCVACIKGVCRFRREEPALPSVVNSVVAAIGL